MNLDKKFQRFNQRRDALLNELDAWPLERLEAKPLAGKWSILEILEHVVVSERLICRGLAAPSELRDRPRTLRHRFGHLIVFFVLKFGIPVKMPSAAMAPQGGQTLADLRRLWDENQRWLEERIDALDSREARRAVLKHPVAGPLTLVQAMRLGQLHFETHVRQIRRLERLLA